jgi:hypothetical protein
MVRRPTADLEQLVHKLSGQRIARERLVRAPAPDCVLDIHGVAR